MCEVKVMCPRYCLRHDLELFISRLTLFEIEKNIIMSISWEMILKGDCMILA